MYTIGKKVCRCIAYSFPHRYGSGRCTIATRSDSPDASEYVYGGDARDDARLDDPRRGQARHINKENGR